MFWIGLLLFVTLATVILAVMFKFSAQVGEQLHQMRCAIQDAHNIIGQNLGSTTAIFGNMREQLGKLEATNTQILEVSRNISSLQELLRAPKFRGQVGETLLENLLAQVLPKEYFSIQHRFKNADVVDAAIKLGERLVPVDAKFSLENFQRMLGAQIEEEKTAFRKRFIQDIKARVDEISSKYILPQENTYDFALMYIPAENVYYEIVVKEDMLGYFTAKKVIPVSPNTFYAYLQVICLGLKGLKIEENTKAVLKGLGALAVELNKFREDFEVLGRHISAAGSRYEDAEKRLVRFSDRLGNIQDTKALEAK
jgi:DNA recombination protein RmuC